MEGYMSLKSRKELLDCIHPQYQQGSWKEKRKMLDGFIAATGYKRKYAISLLNHLLSKGLIYHRRERPVIYTEDVKQALLTVWYASNQICSKRLVPFLPDLVDKLESLGHLSLSCSVKERLLRMSAATIDRLLRSERLKNRQGLVTSRLGNLLRKQIQVKTSTHWNETIPGFLEVDLVAHCGGNTQGSFLNTLVLTDVAGQSAYPCYVRVMQMLSLLYK